MPSLAVRSCLAVSTAGEGACANLRGRKQPSMGRRESAPGPRWRALITKSNDGRAAMAACTRTRSRLHGRRASWCRILEPDRFTWKRLSRVQVKRESVSTLLIWSKIHVLAGDRPGLVSDSIKNDLAPRLRRRLSVRSAYVCVLGAAVPARLWDHSAGDAAGSLVVGGTSAFLRVVRVRITT